MTHVVGIGGSAVLAYLVLTTTLAAYPVVVVMLCVGVFLVAMAS